MSRRIVHDPEITAWLNSLTGPIEFKRVPQPKRNYRLELMEGDALRQQRKAIKLCWLPGEEMYEC